MFKLARSLSKLQTLSAKWRVLLHFTTNFAREILQIERCDPKRALQKAEQLELWTRTAMFQLSAEAAAAVDTKSGKKDAHAYEHLGVIAFLLVIVLKIAIEIRQRLEKRTSFVKFHTFAAHTSPWVNTPSRPLPYIDTS